MTHIISPGATIGVLGSGQLGRMFTIAARRLGYRVHVLSPDSDTPTGQVADVETTAEYIDLDAIRRFAQSVDVVTFEFENVPVEAIAAIDKYVPVYPDSEVLHTTQQRLREKTYLQKAGVPVTPFAVIDALSDLQHAMQDGKHAVLKTAAWGYDGKGQVTLRSRAEIETAWQTLGASAAILEDYVDYDCELSVVAARSSNGNIEFCGPLLNQHVNHILDVTVAPANLPERISSEACEITRTVMENLNVVGVLCVEFFLRSDGAQLVNELAPRPHNSGHLTIDAHETCQFEQQVRAVCGLPLGSARQHTPAAMVNLLGDLWSTSEPAWERALANSSVKLHLYGKQVPRAGRKMGHLTALASDGSLAIQMALDSRAALVTM